MGLLDVLNWRVPSDQECDRQAGLTRSAQEPTASALPGARPIGLCQCEPRASSRSSTPAFARSWTGLARSSIVGAKDCTCPIRRLGVWFGREKCGESCALRPTLAFGVGHDGPGSIA